MRLLTPIQSFLYPTIFLSVRIHLYEGGVRRRYYLALVKYIAVSLIRGGCVRVVAPGLIGITRVSMRA